jgi:predicted SnoaL-like aldol condensation-catalyzing enzyme
MRRAGQFNGACKAACPAGDMALVRGGAIHNHCVDNPADPKDRGTAYVDIFRVQGGKIVAHWDVGQPVPEKSANNNTMF